VIPLLEVVGSNGAVVPAQNGGMEEKVGINIGFDKMIPIKRFVVHPLINNEKLEYRPAFNPDITIWPDPFATKETGPTGTPSSV